MLPLASGSTLRRSPTNGVEPGSGGLPPFTWKRKLVERATFTSSATTSISGPAVRTPASSPVLMVSSASVIAVLLNVAVAMFTSTNGLDALPSPLFVIWTSESVTLIVSKASLAARIVDPLPKALPPNPDVAASPPLSSVVALTTRRSPAAPAPPPATVKPPACARPSKLMSGPAIRLMTPGLLVL